MQSIFQPVKSGGDKKKDTQCTIQNNFTNVQRIIILNRTEIKIAGNWISIKKS